MPQVIMDIQPPPHIPKAEEIVPIVEKQIADYESLINHLTQQVTLQDACFDNVISPLAALDCKHSGAEAVIAGLQYCSPDEATRDAVEQVKSLWRQSWTSMERKDLFNIIKAVKDKGEPLDAESQKLVDRKLLSYTQSGWGIPNIGEATVSQRLQTQKETSMLCSKFQTNLRAYNGGIWLADAELDGLPQKELDRHDKLRDDGKRYVSLNKDSVDAMLRYVHSQATRKQIQETYAMRLSENVPLFRRIITLRDESARLVHHKSHASYRLAYRMPKTTEWIENLLHSLAEKLVPYGVKEFQQVEQKKRALSSTYDSLESWDVAYYRRLIEEEMTFDQDKFAEYFPLRHTVSVMLGMFSSYLQLRFVQLPDEKIKESIWSPDVEVWSVWDTRTTYNGNFIGYLYLDLLERPYKHKGNQCVNLQPSYIREDGVRVYPATTLMCCFPRPTATTCALLKHQNIVTLFHELGHGIHDLTARTKYSRFHGYNVCLEFGEAIGTMLEHWCWMPDELKAMSCHYTRTSTEYMSSWKDANPGVEPPSREIPEDWVEKTVGQRPQWRLLRYLRQLVESNFDLTVHNPPSHEALLSLDEGELYKTLHQRFLFYSKPEPSFEHVAFGHLTAGYDAGYYSYLCANVFAEEMFQENFAHDPRSQGAWERFRKGILEYGGSRTEREVLEEFLGRPPTTDALLRNLGLPSL